MSVEWMLYQPMNWTHETKQCHVFEIVLENVYVSLCFTYDFLFHRLTGHKRTSTWKSNVIAVKCGNRTIFVCMYTFMFVYVWTNISKLGFQTEYIKYLKTWNKLQQKRNCLATGWCNFSLLSKFAQNNCRKE